MSCVSLRVFLPLLFSLFFSFTAEERNTSGQQVAAKWKTTLHLGAKVWRDEVVGVRALVRKMMPRSRLCIQKTEREVRARIINDRFVTEWFNLRFARRLFLHFPRALSSRPDVRCSSSERVDLYLVPRFRYEHSGAATKNNTFLPCCPKDATHHTSGELSRRQSSRTA